MSLDALAFGPHPDDVELFAGGLVATLVRREYRVGIVDLTRGELASHGDVETRAAEAQAAAAVLGVTVRENLGLPDGGLFAFDAREQGAGQEGGALDTPVLRLVALLRRLKPEFVIAPAAIERHPDHEAASALITRAVFLAALRKVRDQEDQPPHSPRQVLYYSMRHEVPPTFIVDISDVVDTKLEAIRCHASQLGGPTGTKQTLVGSPLAMAAIEARDRYHGALIGVAAGEPYVIREALGLVDPIAHFRGNTFARPHFFPSRRS